MKNHEKPSKNPVKRDSTLILLEKKPLFSGELSGNPGHPGHPRQDWFRIDPNFGTTEDMKRLVNKTHELGDMAVNWLDMVRLC